jgi:hypothetical protein
MAANFLEMGTLNLLLAQGRAQCQAQRGKSNGQCACCIIRIYQVVQETLLTKRSVYFYGYAKVLLTHCDKVNKYDWEGHADIELMPDYTGRFRMSKALNRQIPLTDFIPW